MTSPGTTDRSTNPRARFSIATALLLVSSLLLALNLLLLVQDRLLRKSSAEARELSPPAELHEFERRRIEVFRSASPSVVHITTLKVQARPFSTNSREVPAGTGSGFIWDEAAHIVTNFHVIQGASRAVVTLADQRSFEARLVGLDPDHDLAVLRLEAAPEDLVALPLGQSKNLLVGQQALAIGNPFGLDQTLTTGVVSALDREIESANGRPIRGVIQTDAAINPGNSGGPLLDSSGRLIGVNTAIYSRTGASVGIGFAIPVDTVRRIVPELIAHGRRIRPGLGVQLASESVNARLKLLGVLVLSTVPGSGAERAGIRSTQRNNDGRLVLGDVITAISGRPIRSIDDIHIALEETKVGESVIVRVEREGKSLDLKVELHDLS